MREVDKQGDEIFAPWSNHSQNENNNALGQLVGRSYRGERLSAYFYWSVGIYEMSKKERRQAS